MRFNPGLIKFYTYIACASLFLSASSWNKGALNGEEILAKSREAILKSKTIRYDFYTQLKSPDKEDTIFMNGKASLERITTDSLTGCHFKTESFFGKDTSSIKYQFFYDGTVFIRLSERKAYIDHSTKQGFKNPDHIKKNAVFFGLMEDLCMKDPFKTITSATAEITVRPGEKCGDYFCYVLEIKYKDTGVFDNRYTLLFIDRKTFLPVRRVDHYEYMKKHLYTDFAVSHLQTNNKEIKEQIKELQIEGDFELKEAQAPDNRVIESPSLLKKGTQAPDFELALFATKEPLKLSSLKGKVVLLVFWYMNCYPCEAQFPHIESLYNPGVNKDLAIVGINPIDTKTGNQEILDYLKSKNQFYLNGSDNGKKINNAYKVWEYPSIYLLDRNQNIIFTYVGFDDDLPSKLDSAVAAVLK